MRDEQHHYIGTIRYDRFDAIIKGIRRCQDMSRILGEPQCISLEGRSGAGKTTLVTYYESKFPRRETEHGSEIPIFYTGTPSPITVKGMAESMLASLGDPLADRGTLTTLNRRLQYYLKACKVELVILDDIHHLIDAETNKVLQRVSDWLKVLIKETRIPFLIVGVEGKNQRILENNEQLSRLFAMRTTLGAFTWNPADYGQVTELNVWVRNVEAVLERRLSRELSRQDLLAQLYYATDGLAGHLINLLSFAGRYTEEHCQEELSLAALAWAFELRVAPHFSDKVNPFAKTVQGMFVTPVENTSSDSPEGVGNRSQRRKAR